jgi:hypothetical protein
VAFSGFGVRKVIGEGGAEDWDAESIEYRVSSIGGVLVLG